MAYLDLFNMPNPVTISARTSSITNSFVNGIIPCVQPTEEEVRDALTVLGMDENNFSCAYCGDPCTEWDHLNPLVVNKQPTGYCSEIHNLVPSCGKCNQSKGNKNWHDWMLGPAAKSPATRGVEDLATRVARLETYCETFKPIRIDFEAIVGEEKWSEHWNNHAEIIQMMRKSQSTSNEIRKLILSALSDSGNQGASHTEANNYLHQNNAHHGNGAMKVGEIAKRVLAPYIQSSQCPQDDIDLLSDPDHSQKTFGISYPALLRCTSEDLNEKRMVNGQPRYYSDALVVNGQLYLLTKEWKSGNRQRLIEWLETRGVEVDSAIY